MTSPWIRLSIAVALVAAMPLAAAAPTGVSPGAAAQFAPVASGCPTFLWAAPPGAGFEIVVQSATGSEETVLRHELPAAAGGWTPPADRCLAPGRYAWAVRDLGATDAAPWSAPLLFTVPEALPAAGDLDAAIALLGERLAGDPEARRRLLEALAPAAPGAARATAAAGRSPAAKSATAAGTAVYGEVADASGETYGLRGVSRSPAGAGVRAENLASGPVAGPDLLLGHPTEPALVTESGLLRSSASNLSFHFANPGAGTMTLLVEGAAVLTDGDATVQRRTAPSALSCSAGQFLRAVAADGAPTCAADATGPAGWSLAGNAGTNPATNFVGTTDAQPFVVRTANARSLRIEPSAETFGAPALPITTNSIGGSHANEVTAGVRGATIAGGGMPSGNSDPNLLTEAPNRVTDHYGTVGGGYGNQAGDAAGITLDRLAATVGGGRLNTASGSSSTVGGGEENTASGQHSTVGGGLQNTASGQHSTVGGGLQNTAFGGYSSVSGGYSNIASSLWSTVGGGYLNAASNASSTVAGGQANTASGVRSTVSGGLGNCAGGNLSWAGGHRAKVLPGLTSGPPGNGCQGLPTSGDDGHEGTFIWADSTDADFVSSGSDRFLVRASGGVAFNTSTPLTDFDVVGNRSGHAALIRNLATSSPDGLAIRLNVAGNPTTTNNFLTFQRADGSSVGSVEGNGAGGVSFNTAGGDYAEWLPKEDPDLDLPPGTVVGLRGGRVSLETEGAEQLAVVSGRPAVAGNDPGAAARGGFALVAFLGQVDVLVAGPVAPGDLLLPSGQGDGLARAVPPQALEPAGLAAVLGHAWEGARGPGPHAVRALVGLRPAAAAEGRALAALAGRLARAEGANRDLAARLARLEAALAGSAAR